MQVFLSGTMPRAKYEAIESSVSKPLSDLLPRLFFSVTLILYVYFLPLAMFKIELLMSLPLTSLLNLLLFSSFFLRSLLENFWL